MAAQQAPPSLGFSRQEHWSGLPFPSPMLESEKWKEVAQSCLTLHDPMDCSPPGSSIHGTLKSRVLEWGAIALSHIHVYSHRLQLTFIYTYVPSSFSIQCYFATEFLFILQDSVVQVYFLRTSLMILSLEKMYDRYNLKNYYFNWIFMHSQTENIFSRMLYLNCTIYI